jgi:hypothetical protein
MLLRTILARTCRQTVHPACQIGLKSLARILLK